MPAGMKIGSSSFNEAAAFSPRKSAQAVGRRHRLLRASMRPRHFRRGNRLPPSGCRTIETRALDARCITTSGRIRLAPTAFSMTTMSNSRLASVFQLASAPGIVATTSALAPALRHPLVPTHLPIISRAPCASPPRTYYAGSRLADRPCPPARGRGSTRGRHDR